MPCGLGCEPSMRRFLTVLIKVRRAPKSSSAANLNKKTNSRDFRGNCSLASRAIRSGCARQQAWRQAMAAFRFIFASVNPISLRKCWHCAFAITLMESLPRPFWVFLMIPKFWQKSNAAASSRNKVAHMTFASTSVGRTISKTRVILKRQIWLWPLIAILILSVLGFAVIVRFLPR